MTEQSTFPPRGWVKGDPTPAAPIAPPFRAVSRTGEVVHPPTDLAEQYCRTVALANYPALLPDAAEIAQLREDLAEQTAIADTLVDEKHELREKLTNLRHELDDAMDHLRRATESNAGLVKWAGAYHSERDEQRERADEYADMLKESRTRVGELEDEIAELKRDAAWMSEAGL